ncbi:hypothetical protein BDB00DRAFT_898766 [Zychaea mexicana]|uniref:uncharacterized protein n=1 Tax=Zychaea mexicana TaxID=64656 RepID=UPI0022FDBF83|nr:uncharacterized protein BDB00DRAFT_905875 [Zychaea mexicana]XP_052981701.1 uncharacterized protein BDB00DRAFT_898766 [Zychaea mexicana]KAI9466391.1 hypothetical protein BDB00DRAFT_905875 [Zychaea mexicana]KAI9495436.1 hypothetical protein BDB00DRAFT_898766 [Zychaea mexicana]
MQPNSESSLSCPMLIERPKEEDVRIKEANTKRDYVRYTVECSSSSSSSKAVGDSHSNCSEQYNTFPDSIFLKVVKKWVLGVF